MFEIFTVKAYSINADIYSVKNFDPDCIVAVNFEGTDEYYIYTNAYYSPKTLGDFINTLDPIFISIYLNRPKLKT